MREIKTAKRKVAAKSAAKKPVPPPMKPLEPVCELVPIMVRPQMPEQRMFKDTNGKWFKLVPDSSIEVSVYFWWEPAPRSLVCLEILSNLTMEKAVAHATKTWPQYKGQIRIERLLKMYDPT